MAARTRKSRKANSGDLRAEVFLRSINLHYDATAPERIAHFRPTAKSVRMLQSLCDDAGERAFFIVAPYGTGKSLAATYLLHLVENRPESHEALRKIEKRFEEVSPDFAKFANRNVATLNLSVQIIGPTLHYRPSSL